MSPMRLWYSQKRAVSMRPVQNEFIIEIWSDRDRPSWILFASRSTNSLI